MHGGTFLPKLVRVRRIERVHSVRAENTPHVHDSACFRPPRRRFSLSAALRHHSTSECLATQSQPRAFSRGGALVSLAPIITPDILLFFRYHHDRCSRRSPALYRSRGLTPFCAVSVELRSLKLISTSGSQTRITTKTTGKGGRSKGLPHPPAKHKTFMAYGRPYVCDLNSKTIVQVW